MNRRSMRRLRDANPRASLGPAPIALFEQITNQRPTGSIDVRASKGLRARSRAAKVIGVGLCALLVGVGVAWSATGNNPVAVVIDKVGNRLMSPAPGTNLFASGRESLPAGLSIVEPADQAEIDNLPEFTLTMLQMQQTGFRQEDLDRIKTEADFERLPYVIHPKFIRATGQTTLPTGQTVSVVVLEDEICAYWLEIKAAMCGSEKNFLSKGIYQFRVGHPRKGPWEIFGLVDDRVAWVSAESSNEVRRATVENNVFQMAPLPPFDVTLTAYGSDGEVLYSTFFR